MKIFWRHLGLIGVVAALGCSSAYGQVEQRLGVVEEKVDKLRAQMESVQFQQQQMAKQIDDLQAQINQLRKVEGGASATDLQALDDRVKALDAARQKDKQVILDTLAKELAKIAGGKTPPPASSGGSKEHVVQKGETLSVIAKAAGVTVAELKKANNLTGDEIKVGQKLVIPK